jgi:cellular nucleic acid-binding protein
MFIYVLQLSHYKFYIGIGSAWTKKFKPIFIKEVIKMTSKFDEDNYTKEYMQKYGINNVRGGSYANIELNRMQKYTLQQEIRSAGDLCFKCGSSNHFIANCDVNNIVVSGGSSVAIGNSTNSLWYNFFIEFKNDLNDFFG